MLESAVVAVDVEAVREAISLGANIDQQFSSQYAVYQDEMQNPLFVACIHGNVEIVQLLVSHGAKLDADDWSDDYCIHAACRMCQPAPQVVDCITDQVCICGDVHTWLGYRSNI